MNPSLESNVPAWYSALTQIMDEAESLGAGDSSSFYTQDGVLTMETDAGSHFDEFLKLGWADMGGGRVEKSMVFDEGVAPTVFPVEQPSVEFTNPVAWLKEADRRKAEGHALVSWDDPLRRLVGFHDDTADEWLTIPLAYLRNYGDSVRDEDKDWFLARMAHLKTPKDRLAYFAGSVTS